MYSEFATDPKVQMMSEADQRRFVMLLCLRCSNGDVTLHDEEVTFQLRISNEEWARTKALFLSKNIIDGDNRPTAWDRRQFVSDSSAARVATHRARKKQTSNGDVTLQKRPQNTDTDTEKNIKKTLPIGSAKEKRNTTPQRRATQIPDDYELTDAMRQFYTERLPRGDIDATWQHFTDHHRAKGSVMKDWTAAWRTWVGNELKFLQQGTRNVTPIRNGRSGFVHHTAAVAERAFAGCDVPEF